MTTSYYDEGYQQGYDDAKGKLGNRPNPYGESFDYKGAGKHSNWARGYGDGRHAWEESVKSRERFSEYMENE